MEGGSTIFYMTKEENLMATELRLGLPGASEQAEKPASPALRGNKRPLVNAMDASEGCTSPPKAQVVGWPPVTAFRKNSFGTTRNDNIEGELPAVAKTTGGGGSIGMYVKVSMEGVPYLRKTDLELYKGYEELEAALAAMFEHLSSVFNYGTCNATSSFTHRFVVAYEDKDGDLMLAGDVPWEMFTSSCRRLRIMRGIKE